MKVKEYMEVGISIVHLTLEDFLNLFAYEVNLQLHLNKLNLLIMATNLNPHFPPKFP